MQQTIHFARQLTVLPTFCTNTIVIQATAGSSPTDKGLWQRRILYTRFLVAVAPQEFVDECDGAADEQHQRRPSRRADKIVKRRKILLSQNEKTIDHPVAADESSY